MSLQLQRWSVATISANLIMNNSNPISCSSNKLQQPCEVQLIKLAKTQAAALEEAPTEQEEVEEEEEAAEALGNALGDSKILQRSSFGS